MALELSKFFAPNKILASILSTDSVPPTRCFVLANDDSQDNLGQVEAMQIALRILLHKQGDCLCDECLKTYLFLNQDIVSLGTSAGYAHIIQLLEREKTLEIFSALLVVQAVNHLLCKAQAWLWEGYSQASVLRKASDELRTHVVGLQESVLTFCRDVLHNSQHELQDVVLPSLKQRSALMRSYKALSDALPLQIPVSILRTLIPWAHIKSHSHSKHIFIEGAEHISLSVSATLLKFCEELPPNVSVSLITTNLASLTPTLRSRFVCYHIEEKETTHEPPYVYPIRHVLRKKHVMVQHETYAKIFIDALRAGAPFPSILAKEIKKEQGDVVLHQVLTSLITVLRSLLFSRVAKTPCENSETSPKKIAGEISGEVIGETARTISDITVARLQQAYRLCVRVKFSRETYNLSPISLLEAFYYNILTYHELFVLKT